jgi:AcrR family transcriptional regulator
VETKLSANEARGADTRRRLIEAAWHAIARHGLAGTTTRIVARDAGISHGMCHYHFATKDDLMLAVVDHERHYWIEPMEELVERSDSAIERLDAVVRWMAEPATRDVMRVHLQLVAQSEYDDRLRERMAAEYARWQAAYIRLFAELRMEGMLRPGVDGDAVAIAFATLADGLVDQQSLDPSMDTMAIMRAFLDGLLAQA